MLLTSQTYHDMRWLCLFLSLFKFLFYFDYFILLFDCCNNGILAETMVSMVICPKNVNNVWLRQNALFSRRVGVPFDSTSFSISFSLRLRYSLSFCTLSSSFSYCRTVPPIISMISFSVDIKRSVRNVLMTCSLVILLLARSYFISAYSKAECKHKSLWSYDHVYVPL